MGWVKMKLGDVLKNREGRFKPNNPTIANLKRIDKINFSGQIFLSDKSSNTDMILIKKGDLVISGINVEKGALTVYEGDEDILATIHYSSYIFDTSKIDIDFLKVFLRSPDFVQLLKEQVPGGIKTEIKPKHILPLEVYFPETTKEQKIIAEHFFEKEAKFNQLDEHISYQLTQLDNLNQAILQEAVQGKLVPQDPNDEPASELLKRIKAEKAKSGKKEKTLPPIKPEEIPFEIPENWDWCRLGDLRDFRYTLSYGVLVPGNEVPDGIPFVRVQDLDFADSGLPPSKRISPAIEKQFAKTRLVGGEILICVVGSIGKVALAPDNWIGGNIARAVCRFMPNPSIERKYIYYCLVSPFIQNFFLQGQKSINPTLNVNILETTLIPLPPLSEQKRIVAEIEKQFAKTKQLKEHIIANQQATEQLLKALLHQAFEVREMETA
jgi:type I restriction enzyme S subunit